MTRTSVALPLAALAIALALIVAAIKLVLRAPGIPYNVSELFLDDASVVSVGFFALGLIWIGAGAMLTALVLTNSRRPYLVLPIAILVVSLISKMLISRGVTYESLDDILGSNNLFGLVTTQGSWGEWWRGTFLRAGADAVDFLERRVRYCALYSIPLITIVFGLLPQATRHGGRRHASDVAWGLTTATAVLWLWASGAIVLLWAATDNLTELIAPRGPLGIPGLLFLFGVIAVAAGNVAFVLTADRSIPRALTATGVSAVCVVLSWLLLNAGLEPHVNKYADVFSGAQFLLGPDRHHQLTSTVLFARWAAVYLAVVGVIAFGAWIVDALAAGRRATWRGSAAPEVS